MFRYVQIITALQWTDAVPQAPIQVMQDIFFLQYTLTYPLFLELLFYKTCCGVCIYSNGILWPIKPCRIDQQSQDLIQFDSICMALLLSDSIAKQLHISK